MLLDDLEKALTRAEPNSVEEYVALRVAAKLGDLPHVYQFQRLCMRLGVMGFLEALKRVAASAKPEEIASQILREYGY